MNKNNGTVDPNIPLVKQLGMDVELEKEALDVDKEMNDVLHRLGKAHCPQGMNYAGTISIHLYVESTAMSKNSYSIANITNIAMKQNLSEALVATALNNATIDIRSHFNPNYKFKTTRKGDKRGIIK